MSSAQINLSFNDIASILWQMQNELRNKEGITGINAMHHINMVLLIRSLNEGHCKKMDIPVELCFDNIKDLSVKDLWLKVYNTAPGQFKDCLVCYIRKDERFGFNKDIPFGIQNESTLHSLLLMAKKIDTKYMFEKTDLIGDIYESFINREGKTMKDLGQYFTDRALIDYLIKLSNPCIKDGEIETIYDGACGTGGFLTQAIDYLNKKDNTINWEQNRYRIYGTDINLNTFALLKLNMYFTTGEIIENLKKEDSLRVEPSRVDGYDVILMNPPFGVKGLKHANMNSKIKALGINGTKGEILFLQNCMTSLAPGGRCAIVVPDGVLFNSTKMYKETRKYLMENFELEKVIKVGEGEFFKNTGVKTAVLFFKKTGNPTEKVEFVQVNKVGGEIEEVPLMEVDMEKIVENDYSLNMNLYKEIEINVCENIDLVLLKELVNIKSYTKSDSNIIIEEGLYPYFTASKSYKLCNLNTEEGEYIIKGTHGSCIKETIHYINGRFSCGNNLILLENKSNNCLKYVFYYLKLNNVFEDLINSTAMPFINANSLLKLKIPLPHLEIQERIVEQLDNIYENEIQNSEKLIESLEKSIEGIMSNTMMRKDCEEFTLNNLFKITKGKIQTSKVEEGTLYPIISKGKNSTSWKYIDTYSIEGENIFVASEYAGDGKGLLPINYYVGRCNISCLCYHLKCISEFINIKYIYLLLKSIVELFDERFQSGSCKKTLDLKILKKLKLNLPPIEVQNRIVEECNSKEEIIKLLKNNIEHAERQGREIMDQLFEE